MGEREGGREGALSYHDLKTLVSLCSQPTETETSLRHKAFIWDQRIAIRGAQIQAETWIVSRLQERGSGFLWGKGRRRRRAVLRKSSLVLEEARLGLYLSDCLAIWSSAKSSFISPHKQNILVFTDFLECWQFGPVRKIKKTRHTRQFLWNGCSGSIIIYPLMSLNLYHLAHSLSVSQNQLFPGIVKHGREQQENGSRYPKRVSHLPIVKDMSLEGEQNLLPQNMSVTG